MPANPLLTPGITNGGRDAATHKRWLAVVHQVVRETDGQVVGETMPPDPGRNHYRIRIRTRDDDPLLLLLHADCRLVAATVDDGDPHTLVAPFRDVPRPDLFELAGLRAVQAAELERPLTIDQTDALSPAEQRDIAYHNPPRVGDVIFNWFD